MPAVVPWRNSTLIANCAGLTFTACTALGTMVVLRGSPWRIAAATVAVALVVGMLRWPEFGTVIVLFTIYSNLAVAFLRFNFQPTAGSRLDLDSRSALMAVVGFALVVPLWHYVWVRHEGLIVDRPFGLMLAFLASLLVSALFCIDPVASLQKIARYVCEGIVLYFLVINVIRDGRTLRYALWAVLLAAAGMAGISIFQELTHTNSNPYWGLAQRGGVFAIDQNGNEVMIQTRSAGPIGEQNRYAQILLVALPIAACFFQNERKRSLRLAALIVALLVVGGIVLTFSRGAFIALFAFLVGVALLRVMRWRQVFVMLAVISAIVSAAEPTYMTRLASLARVPSLFQSARRATADDSAAVRLAGNIASVHVFADHPIIGVGRGVYAKYYATKAVYEVGVRQSRNYPSHNLYLNMAAETGMIGTTLFLSIIAINAIRLRRQVKAHANDRHGYTLAACLLLGIVVYMVSGIFLHLAYERYFWLQMALCSAAVRVLTNAKIGDARASIHRIPFDRVGVIVEQK